MNREKYKIGKISELMGVTPEALRYYEREGVISPEKSSASGYRQYSAWDVHILIRTRTYRRYGFTLEETVHALDQSSLSEANELLRQKETQLEETIKEQRRLLKQLKHDRATLRDALVNIGKLRVEKCPAMHFIDTQRSYNIMDDRVDLYRAWIDRVPFTASGGIFEVLKGRDLRYGLMIEDRNLKGLDPSFMTNTFPIPSQKCLTTFFESGSEEELCVDMFSTVFDFMQRRGLTLTGDPFAKAVFMTKDERGAYHSIYQGWVPFEGDCEYCCPPPGQLPKALRGLSPRTSRRRRKRARALRRNGHRP